MSYDRDAAIEAMASRDKGLLVVVHSTQQS